MTATLSCSSILPRSKCKLACLDDCLSECKNESSQECQDLLAGRDITWTELKALCQDQVCNQKEYLPGIDCPAPRAEEGQCEFKVLP